MGTTFRVTMPDGTVATRTSKTKTYTHAVLVTTDNRVRAAALRHDAERFEALARRVEEIVAASQFDRDLVRKHTASNGHGERFYASVVPGDYPYHWLPDHRDGDAWARYRDGAVEKIRSQWDTALRDAIELDGGPAMTYGVYRWSQSPVNAEAGRRECERYAHPGVTASVVEVDAA